jgi:hypothetical protein
MIASGPVSLCYHNLIWPWRYDNIKASRGEVISFRPGSNPSHNGANPMTQADSVYSTPPTNTSAIDDPQSSATAECFEHNPQTFVGCMGPTLVFVGIANRKTFDEIGAPCQDAGENENGHVLVKRVGDHGENEVTVIFQHWIKSRTLDALIADRQAEREAELIRTGGRAQS